MSPTGTPVGAENPVATVALAVDRSPKVELESLFEGAFKPRPTGSPSWTNEA